VLAGIGGSTPSTVVTIRDAGAMQGDSFQLFDIFIGGAGSFRVTSPLERTGLCWLLWAPELPPSNSLREAEAKARPEAVRLFSSFPLLTCFVLAALTDLA
jgi:hypothetical protein